MAEAALDDHIRLLRSVRRRDNRQWLDAVINGILSEICRLRLTKGYDLPLTTPYSLIYGRPMSRYNDYRDRDRRRGFDDSPPPMADRGAFRRPRTDEAPGFRAAPSGPELQATVKWFNPEKGFGFVELSDGSGDVFLHARPLEAAGHGSVEPGATLTVRVGQGQKGRQVTEVIGVDTSTADPSRGGPPRTGGFAGGGGGGGGFGGAPRRGGGGPRMDDGPTEEKFGSVKWYNPDKGFGFIAPEGGGKDVFVHATALQRSRLSALAEGQRVRVTIGQGPKGPEARMVEPLDE